MPIFYEREQNAQPPLEKKKQPPNLGFLAQNTGMRVYLARKSLLFIYGLVKKKTGSKAQKGFEVS